jgi:uncharacterized protein (TIGR02594 family)
MRSNNCILILAVGCVSLVTLSIPAFSRPLPSGGEPQPTSRAAQSKHAKPAAKPQKPKHVARWPGGEPARTRAPVSKPLFGRPTLVSEARKYMGTNPTARSRLWCATFMNMVLAKAGYSGTNSDAAKSFASYGRRVSEPRVGAIAVLTRGKRGGHVGVVSGVDKNGNPIIISGNHNKRVGESVYPRSRVIAYVMPTDGGPTTTQIADRAPAGSGRAGSEPSLDSPIAELIAAIESEQNRPERPPVPAAQVQAAAQPQPAAVPQRVVEQLSAAPHRVAQPEAPARPHALPRNLPLDPALAVLFGIKERGRTPR